MIDLYFAPTPNGWKAAIMLEETGLDYRAILMRLAEGDQFAPAFLAISPNAKMPAIVDHAPGEGWGADPCGCSNRAPSCCILQTRRRASRRRRGICAPARR